MGIIDNDLTSLWRIGPPAERAYAVEPVGVDIIRPSPFT